MKLLLVGPQGGNGEKLICHNILFNFFFVSNFQISSSTCGQCDFQTWPSICAVGVLNFLPRDDAVFHFQEEGYGEPAGGGTDGVSHGGDGPFLHLCLPADQGG